MKRARPYGFTLIEIVMVVLLVSILAAVALPQFIDFRKDAKDAATQSALGAFRASIQIATSAIALREDSTTSPPAYPTLAEMQGNIYIAASPSLHPVLAGKNILDAAAGVPKNQWGSNSATIQDCTGSAKGTLLASPNANNGWCYNPTNGQIWANSNKNGGTTTENNF